MAVPLQFTPDEVTTVCAVIEGCALEAKKDGSKKGAVAYAQLLDFASRIRQSSMPEASVNDEALREMAKSTMDALSKNDVPSAQLLVQNMLEHCIRVSPDPARAVANELRDILLKSAIDQVQETGKRVLRDCLKPLNTHMLETFGDPSSTVKLTDVLAELDFVATEISEDKDPFADD